MASLLSQINSAIIDADSYKVSHWFQYPEGTEYVSSYIEARSSRYAKYLGREYDFTVFFGLQAFLRDYLSIPVTQDDIDLAEALFDMHGEPFNKEGWQYIVDHHGGKLPIEVRALAEGTVLPTSNALVEIVNTDPKCYWLTSYVETSMLRAVWYPTTVATKSRIIKEMCRSALEETAEDVNNTLAFMLHDFGARGNSSLESSGIGGMAHLVNFMGTDTVMGIVDSLAHYRAEYDALIEKHGGNVKRAMTQMLKDMKARGETLPGLSVIASEHSTMTILGRDGEASQIGKLIAEAKKGKIASIVSDSYDYYNNLENVYGGLYRDDIIEAGKNGGRVVIRPDSGEPVEIILRSLEILDRKFGCAVNAKGYKVLPPYLRLLQGDGIDLDNVQNILKAVMAAGYSVENIVFGMGGALEQRVNRDELSFVQKASAARINGKWHDVHKDPITADHTFIKKSKKGRLSTVFDGASFKTIRTSDLKPGEKDEMQPVFRNGHTIGFHTFNAVRARAEKFATLLLKRKPALKAA